MIPLNENSLIGGEFRRAGRLIVGAAKLANEWRDTLFYSALAAYTVFDFAQTGQFNRLILGIASPLEVARRREFLRGGLWWFAKQQYRIAGDNSNPVDNRRLGSSALFVHDVAVASRAIAPAIIGMPPDIGSAAFWLVGATACCWWGGGLNQIYPAYRDIMWDWPRKKGGGGMTQTQKLKDGVKAGFATLKGILGGSHEPLPAPAQCTAMPHAAGLNPS